ncbi:unnamed protein product [Somion occarium]|uniref:Uncharacterized protein n=1 Tax=Somion occarium TaxID=3059160 RepID=A0ABP1DZB4_9APHY
MLHRMAPLVSSVHQVTSLPIDCLYTLYCFTKSDFKTTLIPVTCFAIAAAPHLKFSYIPETAFWVWLHLLQFVASNQTMDPEEDARNKCDRPIPAGLITLRNAIILRWALVPVVWAYSYWYSVQALYASMALVALTIVYDEVGAHAAHYVIRNIVNGLGFASFEMGATLVASSDRTYLDSTAILAIFLSASIFATTIHAQDFEDVPGDKLIGRRTLPIVHPNWARFTVIATLSFWSFTLWQIWELDFGIASAFVALALYVGYRYIALTSIAQDQTSFKCYNVWLSAAHALPGYYRYFHQ